MKIKLKCAMLIFIIELAYCAGHVLYASPNQYALIIGNSNYTYIAKLNNPTNDAMEVAAAIQNKNFIVTLLIDASLEQMEDALVRFERQLENSKDNIGFFYYAGHGVQSNGINYLLPVECSIKTESLIKSKSLSLQAIMDVLQSAGNKLNIMILDACRDNPFAWSRSLSVRGLAVMPNQPPSSIIMYSTSAGKTAEDGGANNSIFTKCLVENINLKNTEIKTILNLTGRQVTAETNGAQIPAIYYQFFDDYYFDFEQNKEQKENVLVKPLPKQAKENKKSIKIGDKSNGGIVFDITNEGVGKVIAPYDQKSSTWKVADENCKNLNIDNYSDWRLPTCDELELIYKNLVCHGIGGLKLNIYWSSEVGNGNFMKNIDFEYGKISSSVNWLPCYVRAVRSFNIY